MFHENVFLFLDTSNTNRSSQLIPAFSSDSLADTDFSYSYTTPNPPNQPEPKTQLPTNHSDHPIEPDTEPLPQNNHLRRSTRIRQPPSYLKNFHCNLASTTTIQSSKQVSYPLSQYLSYSNLSFACSNYISAIEEPKTYKQAAQFDCWQAAMDTEIHALIQTGMWEFVDPPW